MAYKPSSHSHGKRIETMAFAEVFATEEKATRWFEAWTWPDGGVSCLRCGSGNAYRTKNMKPQPYRCRDCRQYFSLKTGTAMEDSKLPLRKWGWAIYLEMTNLKGVSSMKLHRDIGVTQKTAWLMLHRMRQAFADVAIAFDGPVKVDETYVGGLNSSTLGHRRRDHPGRSPVRKTAVVGAKAAKLAESNLPCDAGRPCRRSRGSVWYGRAGAGVSFFSTARQTGPSMEAS